MVILIDIDNTITNFSEILLKEIQKWYVPARKYNYNDIISYDWFEKLLPNPWVIIDNNMFWDKIKINYEAITTIESWVKQGHKVYFVSASFFNNSLSYKIKKTLEVFNPEIINERNIIVAQDKSTIMGDVMIDDCISNLNDFNKIRICYAQPWNENYSGFFRLNDWKKINEVIQSYATVLW